MAEKKYTIEIDALKFLFTIIVFLFHFHKISNDSAGTPFLWGYLAVEFFFLVSGYFMAESIRKNGENPLASSAGGYVWHKIKPLCLPFITAFFVAFIIRQFILKATLFEVIKNFFLGLYEMLFLQMSAIKTGRAYNGPGWYISSMILSIAVLYPIFKKYRKYIFSVGALLISVLCYGFINQTAGISIVPSTWNNITYIGNIRAIAGLSLGVFCNECCHNFKSKKYVLTRPGKIIFSLAGIVNLALLLGIMQFPLELNLTHGFDYVAVFLCFTLAFLIFSGLCQLPVKVQMILGKHRKFLAEASLLFYLNHRIIIYWLLSLDVNWRLRHYFFYYIVGSLCTTILCKLLLILWGKISQIWKGKILKREDTMLEP